MIEFPDEGERRVRLAQLIGVENRVWVQVEGSSRIFGIADEDIDRADADKTSAVHFLRFELEKPWCATSSRETGSRDRHRSPRLQRGTGSSR